MESTEVVPSREVGHGLLNYKLPDINLKPDAASSSENMSPSSSRSLGLETEKLVERVKQPKVKYNSSVDEFPNADAGNRWVKRLKLSSSNCYIQGIKSSGFSSSSYHESRSKLFSGIPKSNTTSLTPNTETADAKGKALLLSHGWIRRWRRIKSNENSQVMEAFESPKFAGEKLLKGQFPSIAAMALMAKALTCFQQCELQKKGSCIIWNTKTL